MVAQWITNLGRVVRVADVAGHNGWVVEIKAEDTWARKLIVFEYIETVRLPTAVGVGALRVVEDQNLVWLQIGSHGFYKTEKSACK